MELLCPIKQEEEKSCARGDHHLYELNECGICVHVCARVRTLQDLVTAK